MASAFENRGIGRPGRNGREAEAPSAPIKDVAFGVMTGSVLTDWSISVSPPKADVPTPALAANAGGASRCGAVSCAEQSLGGGSRLPVDLVRPMLPMIAVLICTVLIITYVKGLSMWRPRLLGLDQ